ncbi:MAG: Uma2 family endonuclease, partial [Anaerolineae bacterium]|nr:Uma2 family endonuclease [Anaerolineae bacterium]
MAIQQKLYTVEEFEAVAQLPENRDRRLEYIGGEIVEVVSSNYSSKIAANFLAAIGVYIKGKNLGDVTGADGGYMVSGERYIPDVAFISRQRQPEPSHETWNPLPPDLAIEVLSPSDDEKEVAVKIANYLAANTIVWLVRAVDRRISV